MFIDVDHLYSNKKLPIDPLFYADPSSHYIKELEQQLRQKEAKIEYLREHLENVQDLCQMYEDNQERLNLGISGLTALETLVETIMTEDNIDPYFRTELFREAMSELVNYFGS